MNSAVYVRVKKFGIGKTLGIDVFPGGESDMLDRIEITGFEVDTSVTPPKVKTKFRIRQIPSSASGAASSTGISTAIAAADFKANVLTQTVSAVAAEPASEWTNDVTFSALSSAPTDAQGEAGSSNLFASHDGNTAVTVTTPTEETPKVYTSVSSEYQTRENLPNNGTSVTS